ncbi:MAG: branched-chain amino acid ABC transporter permease [Desulfobacteraceae bacterium]|nr:branched-chain amino acid ABC transporter permease [Desulfobacteraceae bacterium]
MNDKAHKIAYAVFALAVILLGWQVDNQYYLQLMIFIGLNTLLALSLNMLMGYAGQISLGHAAFYGIGAYVTAILTTTYQVAPVLALPAAVGTAMLVAWIVGIPTLRLSGYYLGMGTLGFGMIVHIVLREWSSVTGGASGFVGIPPLEIGLVVFASGKNYFFLVWAVVLLCLIMCRRIIDSRVGRALRSIHDGEKAAAAVGVDTKKLKLQVFVFSAGMAALAGFLYAHLVYFISPGTFSFVASIRIVTMVVIGGMASIWGALLGASLLTLLPEWLHAFSEFEMVVYGLILMGVMIFLPRGLTRGVLDVYERYRKNHDR